MLRLLILSALVVITLAFPNVRYQRQIEVQSPTDNQLGQGEKAQEGGTTLDERFGHGGYGQQGHYGGGGYGKFSLKYNYRFYKK